MIIEDILFDHMRGISSTKYDPIVGTLVCSSEAVSLHGKNPSHCDMSFLEDPGANIDCIGVPENRGNRRKYYNTITKAGAMDVYKRR